MDPGIRKIESRFWKMETRIWKMVIRKPVTGEAPAGTRSFVQHLSGYPGGPVGPIYPLRAEGAQSVSEMSAVH